ncbi:sensor histidine kinase [Allosphingosinicella deserti]|nr:ATP-binding protein [Sphingomonas deserti]
MYLHANTSAEREISFDLFAECEAEVQKLRQTIVHLGRVSAMGTTAAMVVHELAQPLTAAYNYLAVARRSLPDERCAEIEQLAKAVELAELCLVQVSDVIRSVRGAASTHAVAHHAVDLRTIVDDVLRLYGAAWDFTLGIEIMPWAALVVGDPIQLGQVLQNLIRNAADATAGQADRSLTMNADIVRGMVEVRIEDNGPGIPDSHKADLFSPFNSTKADGLGVGLSICRTIVENHKGRIWMERLPAGTAFCFTLLPA